MSGYDLSKYQGVIVAMNSCYDAKGEIDPAAAKRLTRFLIEKGVNGLYVGGSTGEGLIQSVEERKTMLEAVLEEAKGKVTVIAHIGAITTKDSIELAVHAEAAGADAISAVPPFYYRCSERAVARHWSAITDSSNLPFIIYHIPTTTGFYLSPGLLKEMIRNPKVIGVKISSPSVFELQQFKAIGGDRFLLLNGPDEQYLAGRVMGASAGIGGTYGVMPELFVALERHIRAGRMEEARAMQFKINDIIAMLLRLPIYAALKELLKMRGIDCGTVRAPLEQVADDQREELYAVYRKLMEYVSECEKAEV